MIKTIKAGEIKVNTKIYEADGFEFEVAEIVKETEKTITVRLINDSTIDKRCWRENGGIVKRFNKSTKVYSGVSSTELEVLLNNKEISQRTFNTLKRAGYNALGEIRVAGAKAIQSIYSMSKVSLKEINNCLLKYYSEQMLFEA
jgi:DNA-directed RNA polymerase alpha subunit